MWLFTENPWPLILGLSVVAIGLLAAWQSRAQQRLLAAAVVTVLLGVVVWIVEQQIVTEREVVETRVMGLRDDVSARDVAKVLRYFSPGEIRLMAMATAGLAMVEFDGRIRITALTTTMSSDDTRAETEFRANASLSVVGTGHVGRQPTLWKLDWRKESGQWRIIKVRRFHPLSRKEMPALSQRR